MQRNTVEMGVGVFMLLGILAVGYLAIQLGKVELWGGAHFNVKARFQTVSGLRTGARVEIAGVSVGKVSSIILDRKNMVALVDMEIEDGLELPDDTIASVRTAGLIGDRYIKLSPGGSDTNLKPGGMIVDTEPAINMEELIGKYVFGGV
ncbi:MAG: outer membrane lipid asymmetry maintenance protein MlaD [Deltaproteobacteria bacterium]|nr:outer membrane lipid asymmetry maintenance protein MlaD [Deltaproteobacteria bacterium]